jgi:hypothetical protein
MSFDPKRFATLQAELARLGFGIIDSPTETGQHEFIVHRWQSSRLLPDLAAVEQLIQVIKGQQARAADGSSASTAGMPGLSAGTGPATYVVTHVRGGPA